MADIYEQHRAAFAQVSAFVVLDASGERVATVAIKFPRDGASRLWAYVHLIGMRMTRGKADGYGYDKRSAAVAAAIAAIKPQTAPDDGDPAWRHEHHAAQLELLAKWHALAPLMDCRDWQRPLHDAGYTVLQAV
jgi:hypothetical protein